MKNAVKLAFGIAVATVGIAACTSTPDANHGAAPTTPDPLSAPPSSSSTVVTEITTVTVTNPAQQPESLVKIDNRLGYGALKLHMTLEEAVAAGMEDVELGPEPGACTRTDNVAISRKYGIERITLPAEAKTSLGIGVGATVADVKKVYPGAKSFNGGYSVKLNDTGRYWFSVTSKLNGPYADTDKVEAIKIVATLAECPNAAF